MVGKYQLFNSWTGMTGFTGFFRIIRIGKDWGGRGERGGRGAMSNIQQNNIQCPSGRPTTNGGGGPDSPTAQGRGGLMAWRRGNRGPANAQRRGGGAISNIQQNNIQCSSGRPATNSQLRISRIARMGDRAGDKRNRQARMETDGSEGGRSEGGGQRTDGG